MIDQRNQEYTAPIIHHQKVGKNLYVLGLKGDFLAQPGQFYMLRQRKQSPQILSRPFSVMDLLEGEIRFFYRTVGKGTSAFSTLQVGEWMHLYGPYGHGFPVEEYQKKKVALVGGGIGIAPLLLTAKHLDQPDIYLGFRGQDQIREDHSIVKTFGLYGNVHLHLDDDMTTQIDYPNYDAIFTCGPDIMMKKIGQYHETVFASTEKRMGCGLGACLSCTCQVGDIRKKTCTDGPVFLGKELYGHA